MQISGRSFEFSDAAGNPLHWLTHSIALLGRRFHHGLPIAAQSLDTTLTLQFIDVDEPFATRNLKGFRRNRYFLITRVQQNETVPAQHRKINGTDVAAGTVLQNPNAIQLLAGNVVAGGSFVSSQQNRQQDKEDDRMVFW